MSFLILTLHSGFTKQVLLLSNMEDTQHLLQEMALAGDRTTNPARRQIPEFSA